MTTDVPLRSLSGIQPSGALHIGNYFGAVVQHIARQDNAFYFIANYHALTSALDGESVRKNTVEMALDYLALGLDPSRATLFRQSDVPEVTELMWLLMTVTGTGLLERGTQYKDKTGHGHPTTAALFAYPALMAADILAFDADVVPVGRDQSQHLEMCRDMAGHFNTKFGKPVFKSPKALTNETPEIPGIDGKKMSRSYNNTIPVFGEKSYIEAQVKRIRTDSKQKEEKKDPSTCDVYALYALVASDAEKQAMRDRYTAGGLGYGEAKQETAQKLWDFFAQSRDRRAALKRDDVEDILTTHGQKARAIAQGVLARALDACGVTTSRFPGRTP